MRSTVLLRGVVILFAGVLITCEPFEKVSEVPHITFKDFQLSEIDTLSNIIKVGELTFDFIDGDADLGVKTGNESSGDSINFYLFMFEKADGSYSQLPVDTLEYQIRYNEKLDRIGQNKTIKGEISLLIYYFIQPPYDTIKYDFCIYDRARHQSNVESTTDIGFK
ncbi:MAG: hypothetical protein JXA61_06095 [Bacteroidales bacterium]|nr:hypothetical protein [Bacteroidales bacterium]